MQRCSKEISKSKAVTIVHDGKNSAKPVQRRFLIPITAVLLQQNKEIL